MESAPLFSSLRTVCVRDGVEIPVGASSIQIFDKGDAVTELGVMPEDLLHMDSTSSVLSVTFFREKDDSSNPVLNWEFERSQTQEGISEYTFTTPYKEDSSESVDVPLQEEPAGTNWLSFLNPLSFFTGTKIGGAFDPKQGSEIEQTSKFGIHEFRVLDDRQNTYNEERSVLCVQVNITKEKFTKAFSDIPEVAFDGLRVESMQKNEGEAQVKKTIVHYREKSGVTTIFEVRQGKDKSTAELISIFATILAEDKIRLLPDWS